MEKWRLEHPHDTPLHPDGRHQLSRLARRFPIGERALKSSYLRFKGKDNGISRRWGRRDEISVIESAQVKRPDHCLTRGGCVFD